MSMRRNVGAVCLLAILSIAVPSWGQTGSWWPFANSAQQQAATDSAPGVQKDDSQLTVVEANADENAPLVDTANKAKKKNSFWNNKVFHPTQWFKSKK